MQGTTNESGIRTFQATATALAQGVRVQVDSDGLISVAGATDHAIGVTLEPIVASGYGAIKLFSASGTFLVQAHSAMAKGASLYPAAAGRVDDAGTTAIPYRSLDAATAQGDLIEIALSVTGA